MQFQEMFITPQGLTVGGEETDNEVQVIPTVAQGSKSALLSDPHPGRYLSVPLTKFSTFMKERGYCTQYHGGSPRRSGHFDYIFVTTLFTFHWRDYVAAVNDYKKYHPKATILVGGAYASLFPDQMERHTGIHPIVGNIPVVDECRPDPVILKLHALRSEAHIFTTKGCPRGCEFCGASIMEGKPYVIKSWRDHIPAGIPFCMIHDNNILAHGDEHFSAVMAHLAEKKIRHIFDNGFDCRLFERHHAHMIAKTSFKEVRFAFDTMEEDGHLQNAIRLCVEEGIAPHKIKVFVLYNFKDELNDALYRAMEVSKLGATPWAMRYTPLIWGNDSRKYVGDGWERLELTLFNRYVNKYGFIRRMSFEDFKVKICNKTSNHRRSPSQAPVVININPDLDNDFDPESIFNDPQLVDRIIDNNDSNGEGPESRSKN
jgi:hypothetical protein